MTVTMFLALLFGFSVITGLIVEAIKKFINDKENVSYNIVALITALIVGILGCAVYYQFSSIPYTANNIICMVLMGFASALVSMVGYDKVSQAISQITGGRIPDVDISTDE